MKIKSKAWKFFLQDISAEKTIVVIELDVQIIYRQKIHPTCKIKMYVQSNINFM